VLIVGFSGISNGAEYRERYGLRFVGHDSAVAIVADGSVAFAAEEERFSREKHTSALPVQALRAGLRHLGAELGDVDLFVYPWHASGRRLAHMWWHHPWRIPPRHWPALALAGHRVVRDLMRPAKPLGDLARALGVARLPGVGVAHHLGHSACTYLTSPFERAAVLTIDGQGEDESAVLGEWTGARWRPLQSIHSPDSIGILYGMVTDHLGFRAGWDEYKVMAMAALGDAARFRPAFARLVRLGARGRYRTTGTPLVFKPGVCARMLQRELGLGARAHDEPLEPVHFDLAATLQETTEAVLFHLLRRLRELSSAEDLCLGGGVCLNSVANGKLRRSGLFRRVWIPPVPGDHGGALGAALCAHHQRETTPRRATAFSPYLGPDLEPREIELALAGRTGELAVQRGADVVAEGARALAAGEVVAWCQGRMEYGPRALGSRSILASPSAPGMRERVNSRIKHREPFRPFGAAVLEERAAELFLLDGPSPFMQFVAPVRAEWAERIPAVVFAGTCRVQTVARDGAPRFHALVTECARLTGIPALLNTSFNDNDEPIVCTAEHALRTFLATDLDLLVLGDRLVRRSARTRLDPARRVGGV